MKIRKLCHAGATSPQNWRRGADVKRAGHWHNSAKKLKKGGSLLQPTHGHGVATPRNAGLWPATLLGLQL